MPTHLGDGERAGARLRFTSCCCCCFAAHLCRLATRDNSPRPAERNILAYAALPLPCRLQVATNLPGPPGSWPPLRSCERAAKRATMGLRNMHSKTHTLSLKAHDAPRNPRARIRAGPRAARRPSRASDGACPGGIDFQT